MGWLRGTVETRVMPQHNFELVEHSPVSATLPEKLSGLPHRYRLLLGLVSAAAVALIFVAGYSFLSAGGSFRVLHDEASFRRVMATRVRPGSTIAAIEHFLGDGVDVTEEHQRALVAAAEKCSRLAPESWPDGVTADDQFIGYQFDPTTSYLQFRDGVLVNFNPRDYDKPFQFTGLAP